ncbi:Protein of unknown function [Streptococcus thermophilus]|nr:protein of unknown function [Streptococcus thermophilus]CAD0125560.1 protein of unknown function [Streptococcus thermophilus]CAD0131415.1 protein of unknown function [Streptococcus thermophilus]CAD0140427.1 protein of unknown function [Streptococcus thermophilus]CAD0146071.1 protein of unknown function [Streptococcus thermophilus]
MPALVFPKETMTADSLGAYLYRMMS